MSELPASWVQVELKDVVDRIVGGGTPSKSIPSYYQGEIPWMTVKDMNKSFLTDTVDHITDEAVKNSSTNIIPAGVPIIATRMSLGKIVRASFDSAINQDLKALFVSKEIDQYFFEYWYRSQADHIESLGTGTTVKGVRLEVINALQFPLAPLAEQVYIAQKLDQLLVQVDTLKARIDAIPTLLKHFRQSVLSAAVSGQLTEEWRRHANNKTETASSYLERILNSRRENPIVKFKEPVPPDLEKRELICPEGWVISSVSAFAECLDSMRIPVKKELRNSSKGLYPYFGANGEVDRVDEFIFDYDLVLVTEDETFYGREKPIAYRYSGKCWVNNHVHALRADDRTGRDYLCFTLMYYDVIPWLTGTTGRAKLTQRALLSLPILVPTHLEQTEIVRRVEQLFAFADQLEAKVAAAKNRIDHLTQSILAKAFRGELVPQDPSDEPANVLLERIKAQRAAAPKVKRGRKASV